jgi:hypothetical protein
VCLLPIRLGGTTDFWPSAMIPRQAAIGESDSLTLGSYPQALAVRRPIR